jgi:hypothetical protein
VVDTDYLSFFDARSDVRRDFARASERLVGAAPIYIMVSGPGRAPFASRRTSQALERPAGASSTPSRREHHALDRRFPGGPEPRLRGRCRLGRARAGDPREISHLPLHDPKAKLRRFANTNHSRVNLLVRYRRERLGGGRGAPPASRRRHRRGPSPPELTAVVTGNTVVFAEASDGIAGNQLARWSSPPSAS